MLTASDTRTKSLSSPTVETEIALLNINILTQAAAGNVSAYLGANTLTSFAGNTVVGSPMTLNANYYNVWQTTVTNNALDGQMRSVIDNLTKLGYTVSRKSSDGQYIYWQITW